jgi:hypothetical protein
MIEASSFSSGEKNGSTISVDRVVVHKKLNLGQSERAIASGIDHTLAQLDLGLQKDFPHIERHLAAEDKGSDLVAISIEFNEVNGSRSALCQKIRTIVSGIPGMSEKDILPLGLFARSETDEPTNGTPA